MDEFLEVEEGKGTAFPLPTTETEYEPEEVYMLLGSFSVEIEIVPLQIVQVPLTGKADPLVCENAARDYGVGIGGDGVRGERGGRKREMAREGRD